MFSIFSKNNYNTISVHDLDDKLGKINLIDVREEYEYKGGHVPTAKNIPMGTILSEPEKYLNKSHIKDVKSRYNISYFTDDFEISVGENEIFVLGDNRVNSLDSRELGCFKIEDVLSKKGIILFPFNHMKGMN